MLFTRYIRRINSPFITAVAATVLLTGCATKTGLNSAPVPDPIPIHLSYAEGFESTEAMAESSDLVASGTVTGISDHFVKDQDIPMTDFTVEVDEWISRESPTSSIIVRQTGGVLAGHNYEVEGDPLFQVGQKYVLFLQAAAGEPGIYFVKAGPTGRFIESAGGSITPMPESGIVSAPSSAEKLVEEVSESMEVTPIDTVGSE